LVLTEGIDRNQGDSGSLARQDRNAIYIDPVGPQLFDGAGAVFVVAHRSYETHRGAGPGSRDGSVCALASAVALKAPPDDCLAGARKVI
jgi:hypothetical protein